MIQKFSILLNQVSILFGNLSGKVLAVKKKVVNIKPNIKNTLNKCRNGNPDIQRVITKAVKIKNAEEKINRKY